MTGAQQVMVPDSVIRFIMDSLNQGPLLPQQRLDQLFKLVVKLRNCSPSTLRLAEQYDRGEIDGDQLLEIEMHDPEFPPCVQMLSQACSQHFEKKLTELHLAPLHRLLIMLRDHSQQGLRLAERYASGELSLEQILEYIDDE